MPSGIVSIWSLDSKELWIWTKQALTGHGSHLTRLNLIQWIIAFIQHTIQPCLTYIEPFFINSKILLCNPTSNLKFSPETQRNTHKIHLQSQSFKNSNIKIRCLPLLHGGLLFPDNWKFTAQLEFRETCTLLYSFKNIWKFNLISSVIGMTNRHCYPTGAETCGLTLHLITVLLTYDDLTCIAVNHSRCASSPTFISILGIGLLMADCQPNVSVRCRLHNSQHYDVSLMMCLY